MKRQDVLDFLSRSKPELQARFGVQFYLDDMIDFAGKVRAYVSTKADLCRVDSPMTPPGRG